MKTVQHKFVEFIPNTPENGILYISMHYKSAVHLCMCGCGNKVVTPISPDGWHLTYDGKSITLYPSIGNWNFECRSHYWIKKSQVVNAETWSDRKVASSRSQSNIVPVVESDLLEASDPISPHLKETDMLQPNPAKRERKWHSFLKAIRHALKS